MVIEKNQFFTSAIVVIVALFVALVFSQANKKFALDEVDFPVLAKYISETGTPYNYRGETDPHSLGLWHPPLYAYSLAAFVKVFGFNENTIRAFGMFCTLLSAFLCLLIYRELFQATSWGSGHRISLLFLSIFLLHPYTIANTTVPDIDGTVLPVTVLFFIYWLVKFLWSSKANASNLWPLKYSVFLSLLFGLNLWAKLTTPVLLIPVLFLIVYLKSRSLQRSAVIAITVAVLGGIIFFVTYWLFCYLMTLPFDFAFRWFLFSFTKTSFSDGSTQSFLGKIFNNLQYTKHFVYWFGLPFLFALALSFGSLIFQKVNNESERVLIVLTSFGLFVTLFYLSVTGAFGAFFKYPYTTFHFLALMISHYIHVHMSFKSDRMSTRVLTFNVRHSHILILLSLCLTLLVCYYQGVVAKDIVFIEHRSVSFTLIFSILGIATAISIITARKTEALLLTYGAVMLLIVVVGSQLWISRSQAVAVYPTKYHYGQIGFEKTVSYLKERLDPNEPIWSMKDIGHYANGKWIENYSSITRSEAEITENIQKVIRNNNVRYFVVTSGIGQDRVDAYAGFKSALDKCCVVDQQFGNFIIYKAK